MVQGEGDREKGGGLESKDITLFLECRGLGYKT